MSFKKGCPVKPAPGVFLPFSRAVVQQSWVTDGSVWVQTGNTVDSRGADVGVYPAFKLQKVSAK